MTKLQEKQTNSATTDKAIGICHGQNCYDVGGKALAEILSTQHIAFDIIPCQSLCSYAPTAKKCGKAILRANMMALLEIGTDE